MILNCKDIAEIMQVSPSFVSSVLGNYRFNKFCKNGLYIINKEFINTLKEFLELKRRDYSKNIVRLKLYKSRRR